MREVEDAIEASRTPCPPRSTGRMLFPLREDQPRTPQAQTQAAPRTNIPLLLPDKPSTSNTDSIAAQVANYQSDSYSKELSTLARLYTAVELKYSGSEDSFDQKFDIYLSYCNQAGLPQEALLSGFMNMLKGDALSFYLSNHFNTQDDATIKQVGNLMKKHFKGPEYKISIFNQ
jgi:hypothetical protein